jgi:hypothetical protein
MGRTRLAAFARAGREGPVVNGGKGRVVAPAIEPAGPRGRACPAAAPDSQAAAC